jgi:hypothetical protein
MISWTLVARPPALGVYSTDINMTVDGQLDTTVSPDPETAATNRPSGHWTLSAAAVRCATAL